MSLKVIIKKIDKLSDVTLDLTRRLINLLGDNLVSVESSSECDFNIRIILKRKTWDIVERILKIIEKVEEEHGIIGKIMPEILEIGETRALLDVKLEGINSSIIKDLQKTLAEALGDNLVSVESSSEGDFNIRIILKRKTWDIVERILKIIEKVEEEHGIIGKIMPEILEIGEGDVR